MQAERACDETKKEKKAENLFESQLLPYGLSLQFFSLKSTKKSWGKLVSSKIISKVKGFLS